MGRTPSPHPAAIRDKERRLYHVVERVEEDTVGVKSKRQPIGVSALADPEAVGFAQAVQEQVQRENCLITRGPASADPKKRALGRQNSAASAADETPRPPTQPRIPTPTRTAAKMRNMINTHTAKRDALCKQGAALAERAPVVDDYIQRLEACRAVNGHHLKEGCNKGSLSSDTEGLASAVNDLAVRLKAHTPVMNLFKAHLKLT